MRMILTGVSVVALLTLPAMALAAPAGGTTVHFSGCPMKGIEGGKCVTVKTGQATYDVSDANPAIEMKGLGVMGSGTPTGKPGICMQGEALHVTHWTYTKMKCPIS